MGDTGVNGDVGGAMSTPPPPTDSADSVFAEAKIAVWWDIENCQVPRGSDPHAIARNMSSALAKLNYCGPISISSYGDTTQISPFIQQAFNSTGIALNHVPAGAKDASDKRILVDMMLWAVDNPAPANCVLVSGDRDFSNALHQLRMRRYNILVAQPQNASAALVSAAKTVWLWTSLSAGGPPLNHSESIPLGKENYKTSNFQHGNGSTAHNSNISFTGQFLAPNPHAHKSVVPQGKKAKKLMKKNSQLKGVKNMKRKGNISSGPPSKKRKKSDSGVASHESRSGSGQAKTCPNCKQIHLGKCNEARSCHHCGATRHLKSDCKQLGGSIRDGVGQALAGGKGTTCCRYGTTPPSVPQMTSGSTPAAVSQVMGCGSSLDKGKAGSTSNNVRQAICGGNCHDSSISGDQTLSFTHMAVEVANPYVSHQVMCGRVSGHQERNCQQLTGVSIRDDVSQASGDHQDMSISMSISRFPTPSATHITGGSSPYVTSQAMRGGNEQNMGVSGALTSSITQQTGVTCKALTPRCYHCGEFGHLRKDCQLLTGGSTSRKKCDDSSISGEPAPEITHIAGEKTNPDVPEQVTGGGDSGYKQRDYQSLTGGSIRDDVSQAMGCGHYQDIGISRSPTQSVTHITGGSPPRVASQVMGARSCHDMDISGARTPSITHQTGVPSNARSPRCYLCGEFGHLRRDCQLLTGGSNVSQVTCRGNCHDSSISGNMTPSASHIAGEVDSLDVANQVAGGGESGHQHSACQQLTSGYTRDDVSQDIGGGNHQDMDVSSSSAPSVPHITGWSSPDIANEVMGGGNLQDNGISGTLTPSVTYQAGVDSGALMPRCYRCGEFGHLRKDCHLLEGGTTRDDVRQAMGDINHQDIYISRSSTPSVSHIAGGSCPDVASQIMGCGYYPDMGISGAPTPSITHQTGLASNALTPRCYRCGEFGHLRKECDLLTGGSTREDLSLSMGCGNFNDSSIAGEPRPSFVTRMTGGMASIAAVNQVMGGVNPQSMAISRAPDTTLHSLYHMQHYMP
ncbi:unnamed protein product [Cuscuta campestris]|uniref:CCHC-type domain-containing protein n=1 Tax=Cuscuta campestris TaxID=132261 RepID=A0A484KEA7_9ASTE|nr:unnamed protein product [Cuscuta campestris]